MSIIYDALLKTQKARQVKTDAIVAKEIDAPAALQASPAVTRIRLNMTIILVVTSILLMLLVFVATRSISEQVKTAIPAMATVEVTFPSAKSSASVGAKLSDIWRSFVLLMPKRHSIIESQYKSQHVLNGVFISNDEKIAMINKRMFHRGEELDGMVISAIDSEGVQLQHEDQVIFLRLQG